jgi:hypothetical protein
MKCSAKSSRTGEPCRREAISGGTVCYMHGGAAPQVKRSAAARLAALIDPALGALQDSLDKAADPRVRLMAARDVLDRNLGKAKERHEVTGPDGAAIDLNVSASEILLSRIAGIANREPAKGSDPGTE